MKAFFSVILALVLVSIPLSAFADFVNQDIEDADMMTSDWAKQYGDANVAAGWPQDVSGPGVRWTATPTVSSGWVKIGVGDNFSIRTGTYDFPTILVSTGYFADWTGHDTYQLAFTNNSAASYVFVKPYYTTGSTGYWHDASTWVAPGETRVVSVNLTTLAGGEPGLVPNLATVSHFGFELGMNYANPPTAYGEGNEFDVTVAAQFPVHNVTQDTWHLTIHDGVDNAVANDQITVAAGTYNETVSISNALSLLGAGATTTLLDVSADAGAGSVLTVSGMTGNVTVDGFSFITGPASAKASNAVVLSGIGSGSAITLSNNVLQCVQSASGTAYDNFGLIAQGSDGALLFDHNTVYGGGSNPILLELWRGPATLSYNTVYRGPDDTDASDPIFVMNYGGTNITAPLRIDHNMIDMGGGSIYDSARRGSGITVTAQYTGGAGPGGFTDVEITNNEIVNLKTARRGLGLWDNSSGPGDIAALIQGNTISAAPGYTAEFGIRLLGGVSATQVLDNIVSGVGMGFQARAWNGFDPVAFTVDGNAFTGCGAGVSVDAGTGVVHHNTIAGNTTGLANLTATTIDAACNWWGDLGGPDVPPARPNPLGDPITGPALYAPWLDAPGGVCDQYGDDFVAAEPPAECLSITNTCMTVPAVFHRADATPARGITVTIQLSAELELCDVGSDPTPNPALSIHKGSWLPDGSSYFLVVDNGGGSYTVDQAILGTPCGPTDGGTLFTIDVKPSAGASTDDTGTITVVSVDARDCANPFNVLPGIPGAPATVTIDRTAPAAVTALVAAQVKSGNDDDGTTKITLTFTAPPDAEEVWVYRKGFGHYPEYDDDGGAAPSAPATPAAALADGWALTTVTASGQTDEVAERDFWYFVAFVADACGNVSAVSNRTNGTLNYHLGDFSDGDTPGTGNNLVSTEDISALGDAYGTAEGGAYYRNYIDIGPTTDSSTNGRPATDSKIQFEDLVIFAINYGMVSKPMPGLGGADRNAVALNVGPGADGIEAVVRLSSTGVVQGVSLPLVWNAEAVEPMATRSGELVNRQAGRVLVLSPEPGTVDAAVFGSTFAGTGELAVVTFRVIGTGDPGIRFGEVIARDSENRPIALAATVENRDLPVTPVVTRLLPGAPNPFLGSTQIRFALAEPMPVAIRIYAVDGRLVRTLVDATMTAGEKALAWDGRDDAGRTTAAGAYLLRLETRAVVESQRIVRLP